MNEASKINDGVPLRFDLSGGEAFLDLPKLLTIIAHGYSLGAAVTCVTNGFWASNQDKARSVMATVRSAGLSGLSVSTSRFHQRFVSLATVRRAIKASIEMGVETSLKLAATASELAVGGDARRWRETVPEGGLDHFPIVPPMSDGGELPAVEFWRQPGLPGGRCPGQSVTVREDGNAYVCGSPGGRESFLQLGHIDDFRVEQLAQLLAVRAKFKWLRELGPVHFARMVIEQGEGCHLRSAYANTCDLCTHIARNRTMANIVESAAMRSEMSLLREVLLESGEVAG